MIPPTDPQPSQMRRLVPWQCSNCLQTTMQFTTTPEGYANFVHCPVCKGKGTKHYDRQPSLSQEAETEMTHPSSPSEAVQPKDFEEIDRLLHDADRADAGADLASMMRDTTSAKLLRAKADHLRDIANAIDPQHTAPAWSEND